MRYGKYAVAGLLPVSLLLVLTASSAQAQLTKTISTTNNSAGLSFLLGTNKGNDQTNVTEGNNQSNSDFFELIERQGVSVTNLATDAGTGGNAPTSVTGVVNSFLLYTDARGNSTQAYDITVTSAQKILGVINDHTKLDNTDKLLGRVGTTYPGGDLLRGKEGEDFFTLNTTTNTLVIHNVTSGNVNELRILTASVPELSTSLAFGSFVALGGLAAFRQRKQIKRAA